MVMTLGMSPEIGQRLLGGQQGGGPFMGRDLPGDFRDFSEDFGEKNLNFHEFPITGAAKSPT